LLRTATPFMPKVQSVTSQLAPMIACIRPYAPEAGSAVVDASEWIGTYILEKPNSGIVSYYGKSDGQFVQQHGVRAMPEVSAESVHAFPVGFTSQDFINLTHKQYAYPRVPGGGVGQAWFQPQCGDGPSALNAANDPESHK
jgi:hypothetical protein